MYIIMYVWGALQQKTGPVGGFAWHVLKSGKYLWCVPTHSTLIVQPNKTSLPFTGILQLNCTLKYQKKRFKFHTNHKNDPKYSPYFTPVTRYPTATLHSTTEKKTHITLKVTPRHIIFFNDNYNRVLRGHGQRLTLLYIVIVSLCRKNECLLIRLGC
jgi:hypothetical protein